MPQKGLRREAGGDCASRGEGAGCPRKVCGERLTCNPSRKAAGSLLTRVQTDRSIARTKRSRWAGGRKERTINLPPGPRPHLRLCALAVLSAGLLFAPGGAQATATGTIVGWGCGVSNFGQCGAPAGLSGVTAIAAGFSHSLALKADGTVVAWGCGAGTDHGPCIVPAGLTGVAAIAAGSTQSLALKGDGTVVAWGCGPGTDHGQCRCRPASRV